MKRFIYLIIFTAVGILFTLYVFKWFMSNDTDVHNNDFILIGDSHVEYVSINNVTNFSAPGAYMKVLHMGIEKVNLKHKTVLISIGPHTFADFRTSRYDSLKKHKDVIYTMDTLIPNRIDLYHSNYLLPASGRELFRSSRIYKAKKIKDFEANLSDSLMARTIQRHYPSSVATKDTTELKWFKKLVELIERKGGTVVLLEMPLSKKYLDNIPFKYRKRYDSILADFDTIIKFSRVPDSLFRDGDHVLPKYQSSLLDSVLNQ